MQFAVLLVGPRRNLPGTLVVKKPYKLIAAALMRSHVQTTVKDILEHMTERFELLVNDDRLPGDGSLAIWDNQENKAAVVVAADYGQMVCLERVKPDGTATAFSGLAQWMNSLTNQELQSEGLVATKTLEMHIICFGVDHATPHLDTADAFLDTGVTRKVRFVKATYPKYACSLSRIHASVVEFYKQLHFEVQFILSETDVAFSALQFRPSLWGNVTCFDVTPEPVA